VIRKYKLKTFLRGLFLEDSGKPSFSRTFPAIVIVISIVWVTFLILKNGQMPDLTSLALYLGAILGPTYGANKIATGIQAAINGTPAPPPVIPVAPNPYLDNPEL